MRPSANVTAGASDLSHINRYIMLHVMSKVLPWLLQKRERGARSDMTPTCSAAIRITERSARLTGALLHWRNAHKHNLLLCISCFTIVMNQPTIHASLRQWMMSPFSSETLQRRLLSSTSGGDGWESGLGSIFALLFPFLYHLPAPLGKKNRIYITINPTDYVSHCAPVVDLSLY